MAGGVADILNYLKARAERLPQLEVAAPAPAGFVADDRDAQVAALSAEIDRLRGVVNGMLDAEREVAVRLPAVLREDDAAEPERVMPYHETEPAYMRYKPTLLGGDAGILSAKVVACYDLGGNAWTDYETDGEFAAYCEANPCDDDGGNVDADTTVYVRFPVDPAGEAAPTYWTGVRHCPADTIVRYHEVEGISVGAQAMDGEEAGWLRGLSTYLPGVPMSGIFWFDVTADQAWTVIDGRNWGFNGDATLAGCMYWNGGGPPAEAASWNESNVEWGDLTDGGGWIVQEHAKFMQTRAHSGSFLRWLRSDTYGDFTVRVNNTTGALEVKSENYLGRYQIWLWVVCSGYLAPADVIAIDG